LAPAGIGLIYSPLFEATAALILGYIVYQLSRVNRSGVSPYTGYVFLGFIMLLASHLLFLATPFSANPLLCSSFAADALLPTHARLNAGGVVSW